MTHFWSVLTPEDWAAFLEASNVNWTVTYEPVEPVDDDLDTAPDVRDDPVKVGR